MSAHRPAARSVVPEPGRAGELDAVILAALDTGRLPTEVERAGIDRRHPVGDVGTSCPGCRYRFRRGARSCPSRVYLVSGLRAALAAVPAATATRQCRVCRQPVTVQGGAAGSVVCSSCEAQAPLDLGLFDGTGVA